MSLRLRPTTLDRVSLPIASITVPGDGAELCAELRRSASNPGRLAVYVAGRCREAGITPAEASERWPMVAESIRSECVRGRR
jgi:hypothetical protein